MRRQKLKLRGSEETTEDAVAEFGLPVDVTDHPAPLPAAGPVVAAPSAFDAVLSQEMQSPTVATAALPSPDGADLPPQGSGPGGADAPGERVFEEPHGESSLERDLIRAEMTAARTGPRETGDAPPPSSPVDGLFEAPRRSLVMTGGFQEFGFWDRYDEALASAELFAVPPAAITAIVGSLNVVVPVAQRCRATRWVSDCDVYVLTERPGIIGEPSWTTLRRPSEVVAVLEDGRSDFPLILVDIPRELPAWIRPLLSRIREGGVGLVRYVLDDDPSDEDLATWHGEIGRPSVLDLAAPVPPTRVLELLDRGEPVASVGGMPITADLLMALRLSG